MSRHQLCNDQLKTSGPYNCVRSWRHRVDLAWLHALFGSIWERWFELYNGTGWHLWSRCILDHPCYPCHMCLLQLPPTFYDIIICWFLKILFCCPIVMFHSPSEVRGVRYWKSPFGMTSVVVAATILAGVEVIQGDQLRRSGAGGPAAP